MPDVELVEAILFSAGKPLRLKEIEDATGLEEKIIRSALRKLIRSYKSRNTALDVVKTGPKYSMQLKEEYALETEEVAQKELDREVMKTAALIAYYQPMQKKELLEVVGEKARGHVDELIAQKLIYQNRTNRGYILETAPKFPEFFGLGTTDKIEMKKILTERAGL
ncbi:MAG: SMC-Scp complex subunit ScpB [Thermoplasmata archaeon]|nr:SMC-Scp complex subunit ScpB [Thermoplasmata archaeon]